MRAEQLRSMLIAGGVGASLVLVAITAVSLTLRPSPVVLEAAPAVHGKQLWDGAVDSPIWDQGAAADDDFLTQAAKHHSGFSTLRAAAKATKLEVAGEPIREDGYGGTGGRAHITISNKLKKHLRAVGGVVYWGKPLPEDDPSDPAPVSGFGGSNGRAHVTISDKLQKHLRAIGGTVKWGSPHTDDKQGEVKVSGYGGKNSRPHVTLGRASRKVGATVKYVHPGFGSDVSKPGDGARVQGYGGQHGRAHVSVSRKLRKYLNDNDQQVYWGEPLPDRYGEEEAARGGWPVVKVSDKASGMKRKVVLGSEERKKPVEIDPIPKVEINTLHKDGFRVTSSNSANESTVKYWNDYDVNYENEEEAADDKCNKGTLCALIKNLNEEHLAGTLTTGGKRWNPSLEANKHFTYEGFEHREAGKDLSQCNICVAHALADAGPARYLAGRAVEHHARRNACKAFCEGTV